MTSTESGAVVAGLPTSLFSTAEEEEEEVEEEVEEEAEDDVEEEDEEDEEEGATSIRLAEAAPSVDDPAFADADAIGSAAGMTPPFAACICCCCCCCCSCCCCCCCCCC